MLRCIPFHPDMKLNLSFSISQFHTSNDGRVFDNVNTLENLMRTGTEFISEISATTIFTSFNFHIFRFSSFRFSGKGEVDVYRMCIIIYVYVYVLYCFDPLSQYPVISPPGSFATEKPSCHQPTRHQETITPPTNSPPNKVVEVKKLFK